MSAAAASPKGDTNVKETIESILIAFILAFIFRCFIVEAFVIPTGSMAPTLMGAHLSFRCPDCGYHFDTTFANQDESFSVPEETGKVYGAICPNCGLRLPKTLPGDTDNDAENPTVRYGDRILVMKYLYLLHPPRRWDVVVFKTPDTPRGATGDYTVNYIKRLTGRPNERLFVAEGDLFVAPNNGKAAEETDFVIQTKPRTAQEALWRIVYDADYVPQGIIKRSYTNARGATFDDPAWRQPWQAWSGTGWTNNDPAKGITARQFVFDNQSAAGTLAFDATAIPNTAPLTDWLAYDQTDQQVLSEHDSLDRPSYGLNTSVVRSVPDLKLNVVIDRFEGDGALRAIVGKTGDAEFVAEVTSTTVRLIKRLGPSSRTIGEVARPSGRMRLSIENVDYRVAVCLNGEEKIATSPSDYAPDVTAIVRRAEKGNPGPAGYARIDAERCRAELSHLQLWRDVYYRDSDSGIARGTARRFPENIVELGSDEYFCMGDNSYRSSDGRYWTSDVNLEDESLTAQAGVVPGRFLLGKAFFVYWPAGYRAYPGLPPLVPNFGEMRFIR